MIGISLSCISQKSTTQEPINYKNVIGGSVFFNTATNNSQPVLQPGITFVSSGFLGSTTVTEVKNKGINFSPYYGRKLSDNFMIGALGSYANSNSKSYGLLPLGVGSTITFTDVLLAETNIRTISYGVFARYYLGTEQKLQFFLEPRLTRVTSEREFFNQTIINEEPMDSESKVDRRVIDLRILPGVRYSISNRINLLIGAGLLSYQLGTEEFRTSAPSNIDVIIGIPNPNTREQVTARDVNDFTFSLRSTSLFFSFELKF